MNHRNKINQRNQRNQTNQRNLIDYKLVHTGQHYDYEMSKVFFEDLEIPEPDIYLGVGSGTHAEQTGKVMIEFEKVLFQEKPDLVLVVGDVNSTLACALASVKLDIPVAHVEAGLRSFDRTMPEEINRLLTDQISDFLFTPSPDANENLKKEGIPEEKIFLVGNVMVDSLLYNLGKAQKSDILEKLGLQKELSTANCLLPTAYCSLPTDYCSLPSAYCLLTLHRPSNVDEKDSFLNIIKALTEISKRISIIFPIHPRTRKQIEAFGFEHYFTNSSPHTSHLTPHACGIRCVDPLGYLDFLNLMMHSKFVMTDSGGIQEETTVLGIPCLTLRDTTERPITISQGTNVLVWNDTQKIIDEAFKILNGKGKKGNCPEFWDGKTAERIVETLVR
ncbi:MAG: UDP-N-acetylglucosamine 2-epimerase (non-hydrolyzing) [candidate division Zixibacteria bacterium]|nr:UDP-N-acetylglucosamine 2-epimerase (non-hydrolyzing) [candidate division Zixibacteria bacterium]